MDCLRTLSSNFIFLLLLGSFTLLSCAKTIDITHDEVLRGNYKKGMILIAKKDMVITNENYLWDYKPIVDIVKNGGRLDEYKGLFKPGTKIEILRIELYSHIENGNYIYPIGLVLNGEWKGESVNLHFTSKSSGSPENESYYVDIKEIDTELFEIINGDIKYNYDQ